jgi:hypothetical protein
LSNEQKQGRRIFAGSGEKLPLTLRQPNLQRMLEAQLTQQYFSLQWTTVGENGGSPCLNSTNCLSNSGKPVRGAVLAEPFPWTVSQGVIPVLVIINSRL